VVQYLYRLVRFSVNREEFGILTNRRDLTSFQVIMLYAYRWQIKLLFRFLKRTLNGIHLIKQDHRGVTIHFYAMLIVALLELRLKQITADMDNSEKSTENVASGDETPAISEHQEEDPSDLHQPHETEKPMLSGHTFIETIGKNLHKYWKIGIHWLTALKSLLAEPFDERAVKILNTS